MEELAYVKLNSKASIQQKVKESESTVIHKRIADNL